MDQLEEFTKVKSDKNAFLAINELDERPIVALLAGSRKQEISESLPEMIEASREFSEHQFVVAGAPSVNKELYESLIAGSDIKVIYDDTYNLLNNSEAAVVTSGTATLETALLNVPQVVVYKTAAFTYRLGSLFVNIRFFSLVNLIFGEELVKEILQFNLAEGIKLELRNILFQDEYKLRIEEGYANIKELIGGPGASRRVALRIKELIT
jgi:lipid-A-disaccharide synthase